MNAAPIAAIAAAASLIAFTASAQTACPVNYGPCGFTATTTPQTITLNGNHRYQRICNGSASITMWATRDPKATAATNGVSSFPILPGDCEEYPIAGSPYVPTFATSVVAASPAPGSVETN